MNKRIFTTGLIGTIVSLVCCFSPVLVVGLGAIGLAALVGWLDYIVLPAIAIFAGLMLYGLIAKKAVHPNE